MMLRSRREADPSEILLLFSLPLCATLADLEVRRIIDFIDSIDLSLATLN